MENLTPIKLTKNGILFVVKDEPLAYICTNKKGRGRSINNRITLYKMKLKLQALFRIETLIVLIIFIAFSLNWIHLGKILNISGWGLPDLYRKSTNVSNAILFFSKKDSPHLAKFIYIVPLLGVISILFIYKLKRRIARIFLLFTCIFGTIVSLYMYYYFLSSKMFKLSNAGVGIHLLLIVSITGILYIIMYSGKPKNNEISVLTGDKLTF